MDTELTSDLQAEIRRLECTETLERIVPLLLSYLERGDFCSRKGDFHKLYKLAWKIGERQTLVPLLEERQAQIIDAVASAYDAVSKGRLLDEAQQREALTDALRQVDALPRPRASRDELIDQLVKTRAEIRTRDDKTRHGGGSREAAKVAVGKLRPLLFNVGVKWLGLDRLGEVVGRDAMNDLVGRVKERRAQKPKPKTILTLSLILADAALDDLLDYDLLERVRQAVRDAAEEQRSRDSRARVGAAASALHPPSC